MKIEHPSGISAECIAASSCKDGPPIYTVVTRSPKFIDAEMRTHRMLSQNSSSSRAIPTAKVIEQVKKDPFVPFDWRRNQAGMQGEEHLSDADAAVSSWMVARNVAVEQASYLAELGVHKQHINRLLDPFTHPVGTFRSSLMMSGTCTLPKKIKWYPQQGVLVLAMPIMALALLTGKKT